jgi:DNA-binding protein HU-beta
MTKAEIINKIVAETGLEKPEVIAVVESLMESMKNSMAEGNEIFLRGFGSFILKKRARKVARNITKGTSIDVPAHVIPAFKPAKEFLEEVRTKVKVK